MHLFKNVVVKWTICLLTVCLQSHAYTTAIADEPEAHCSRVSISPYAPTGPLNIGNSGMERLMTLLVDELFRSEADLRANDLKPFEIRMQRTGSRIEINIEGKECSNATDWVKTNLLKTSRIAIGVVGSEPMFSEQDVESALIPKGNINNRYVVLQLFPISADKLHSLTKENIGKSLYIVLKDTKDEITVPINAAANTGQIALYRKDVPEEVINGLSGLHLLKITSCHRCDE